MSISNLTVKKKVYTLKTKKKPFRNSNISTGVDNFSHTKQSANHPPGY